MGNRNKKNKVPKRLITNTHHRRPQCMGGKDYVIVGDERVKNAVSVNQKQHEAFHLLFGSGRSVIDICKVLNHWVDPAYRIICIKKYGYGEAYDRAFEREKKSLMA